MKQQTLITEDVTNLMQNKATILLQITSILMLLHLKMNLTARQGLLRLGNHVCRA